MGAAKFLSGLTRIVDQARLNIIVNTADDDRFYGLEVSPDLDTISYTLAGLANRSSGWGVEGDTFHALDALARFYGHPWFKLGDRDLATHLFRTERLRSGARLSEVTAEIAGRLGLRARVMPMSEQPVRTFIKLKGRAPIPFQEYLVRGRARGVVERIELRGIGAARPLPAALSAIAHSAAVIIAPSNPFVSIGPIVRLKGMRAALARVRAKVAGISPIVSGRPIKGPADRMMRGLGFEVSALGVARLYRNFVGLFVLDERDRRLLEPVRALGMRAVVADTIMTTPAKAQRLAQIVLEALEV